MIGLKKHINRLKKRRIKMLKLRLNKEINESILKSYETKVAQINEMIMIIAVTLQPSVSLIIGLM